MPPYEAMETVLPDYQYVFVDGQGKQQPSQGRGSPTRAVQRPPPPPQAAPAATSMPGAYTKYAAPTARPAYVFVFLFKVTTVEPHLSGNLRSQTDCPDN